MSFIFIPAPKSGFILLNCKTVWYLAAMISTSRLHVLQNMTLLVILTFSTNILVTCHEYDSPSACSLFHVHLSIMQSLIGLPFKNRILACLVALQMDAFCIFNYFCYLHCFSFYSSLTIC